MKQNHTARTKGRAKSAGRGKPNKPKTGSAGNRRDVKVKGNPKQLIEKYKNQAREAAQNGDRVQEEYYLQFADHYQRVVNDMNPGQRSRRQDTVDDVKEVSAQGDGDQPQEISDAADSHASVHPSTGHQNRRGRARQQHPRSGQSSQPNTPEEADGKATVDPSEQAQPKMEYPEDLLKEVSKPVSAKSASSSASTPDTESEPAVDNQSTTGDVQPKRRGRPKKQASPDLKPAETDDGAAA